VKKFAVGQPCAPVDLQECRSVPVAPLVEIRDRIGDGEHLVFQPSRLENAAHLIIEVDRPWQVVD
jgi:hypothetical protein